MKKILFVILTAFAVLNSYGQGGQVYDICYDPGCTLPPTTCPPAPPPPPGCVPPTPTNCPIICRNVVIDNQLDCDLDFWWDYSTTAPCGDIVPAYWACPWQGYSYCPPFTPPTWPPIPPAVHIITRLFMPGSCRNITSLRTEMANTAQ
jgi:hypothetical protein